MEVPSLVRWGIILAVMLAVTFVLVSANFLPWFSTIVGVGAGLVVYHRLFRPKTREETIRQQMQAANRARSVV